MIAIAAFVASSSAQARTCGAKADQDNPMAWDDGFGVSHCRAQKPRYHVHDYDGESAHGYAASSDPMVWSGTQWSGTLFDGYARTYDRRYDTRVRPEPVRPQARLERRFEITISEGVPELAEQTKPRGPKFIGERTLSSFKTNPGVLRFDGHTCRGVLVLTWGSLGGKSRCHDNRTRIHPAPGGGQ